ncbi:MAG: slipin family protein [bacterium]
MFGVSYLVLIVVIAVIMFLWSAIKIMKEYERAVVFFLGRLKGDRGPGLVIIIPVLEKMVKISLRLVTMDVPPQDIITRDNVSVKVNAVIYFRVMAPSKAVVEVEDFYYATSQLAQTTLRSVLGQADLDDLLSEREKINHQLQEILDTQTDPWGIKVTTVEIKHVDLPQDMQRTMAKQAEAERERRAKIIAADGEFQAADKLAQAANILSVNPQALQLRYLQTLREIATENNSTTIFPLPMDLLGAFVKLVDKGGEGDKDKE